LVAQFRLVARKDLEKYENFADFCAHHNNDEVFRYVHLHNMMYGTDITEKTISSSAHSALWKDFFNLIELLSSLALAIDIIFKEHSIEFDVGNEIADVIDKVDNNERPTDAEVAMIDDHTQRMAQICKMIDVGVELNPKLVPLWGKVRDVFMCDLDGTLMGTPRWSGDPPRRKILDIFEIVERPKPLPYSGEQYDVFISYKRKRNANEARYLADALKSMGCKVWFDIDALSLREDERVDKSELAKHLALAVKASRVAVVFAAQKEAVILQPGTTESDALASGDVMVDDYGGIIAWNWQKIEIDNANQMICVHSNCCVVGSEIYGFNSVSELTAVVLRAVGASITYTQ
jgi:hypothetical protein